MLLLVCSKAVESELVNLETSSSSTLIPPPTVSFLPVQTGGVNRSRIGQFNAHVKHGQLENYQSYCVLHSKLCRSE